MKKTLVVLLMGAMLFTACGQSAGSSAQPSETQAEETQTEEAEVTEEAEAPAEAEAEPEAEAPAETEAKPEAEAEAPAAEEAAGEAETVDTAAADATAAVADSPEETAGDPDKLGQARVEMPDYVSVAEGKNIQDLQVAAQTKLGEGNAIPEEAVEIKTEEATEEEMDQAVVNENGVAQLEQKDLGELGAAASATIYASSVLYESGQNHSPQVLLDGYVDTAWVEGVSGYGSGEYVRIGFPAGTVVHGFGIVNGYQKSESLFWKNSAPSTLIVGSGDTLYRLNLTAGYGYYEEFNLGSLVTDGSFYIIIENVRPGSAYKDTCISEIWLW